MAALYLIAGAIVGGGAGWLLGRFNRRRNLRDCKTPTWRATSTPWSGAVTGAILGMIIAVLAGIAV